MRILALDVGGTHVKLLLSGRAKKLEFDSGPHLTAKAMVAAVKKAAAAAGWKYDAVAMGYPGPVAHNCPLAEPHNLGPGWVGFNFKRAFGRPVKILNDAALQAVGSYEGGRML